MNPSKKKKKQYRLFRQTIAQRIADKHFTKWWKEQGFNGPTFMGCFEKGVEVGYKLGRKRKP